MARYFLAGILDLPVILAIATTGAIKGCSEYRAHQRAPTAQTAPSASTSYSAQPLTFAYVFPNGSRLEQGFDSPETMNRFDAFLRGEFLTLKQRTNPSFTLESEPRAIENLADRFDSDHDRVITGNELENVLRRHAERLLQEFEPPSTPEPQSPEHREY